MKLIILALFSLTVYSESVNSSDPKDEDSAPYGKVLSPLHRNSNQHYGSKVAVYSRSDDKLRNLKYNDYGEQFYDDKNEEEYVRNAGRLRNREDNDDDGGEYFRNDDLLRNREGRYRNHDKHYSFEGLFRNLNEQSYGIPENEYFKDEGQGNIRENYYNRALYNLIFTPINIGEAADKAVGQNDMNYYRLMGGIGLGFDKRTATSHGMMAPMTSALLEVVRKNEFKKPLEYST